jgi:spermidine synthase
LRSIVRSYLAVFPHGAAILATNSLETPTVGLVSRRHGERLDASLVRRRLAEWRTYPLDSVGVPDDLALLGSFIAGPRALAALSRSAPLNTDDHPVVAYRAPRLTYTLDSMPRDRLIDLLRELATEESKATPGEILVNAPDSRWLHRLDAYWSARNQFIEAGRNVVPSADVQAMLAQVRGPLFSVLHVSPDFRPAYDPLLNMAAALSRIDVGGALALLSDLEEAQPARPEARQMRHEVSQRCASRAPYPCTHGSL